MSVFVSLFLFFTDCTATSANWEWFKYKFITEEGRVLDTGEDNISHSEGQGYGMLLAVVHNDRETFERIWQWTKENFPLRNEDLFVWDWSPENGEDPEIFDRASDPDIVIAWALALAAEKWNDKSWQSNARYLARRIRTLFVREINGETIILPGTFFSGNDSYVIINLSYWIFPAFKELSNIDNSPVWDKLTATGISLMERARFGPWGLPADWIVLDFNGRFTNLNNVPFNFGYKAARIPLYYIWAGLTNDALLKPYRDFWIKTANEKGLAEILDLENGQIIQREDVMAHRVINQLIDCRLNRHPATIMGKRFGVDNDYYSAVIFMLGQHVIESHMPYCIANGLINDINYPCYEGVDSQCPIDDPIPEKITRGDIRVTVEDYIQIPVTMGRVHYMTYAPNDTDRLFVADSDKGIYVIDNDQLLNDLFLDISELKKPVFLPGQNELGIRSIAFHPDYANPGRPGYLHFYTVHAEVGESLPATPYVKVFHSPYGHTDHYDVVSEWRVDPKNKNLALPDSQREIMRFAQPRPDHNLGQIGFNPAVAENSPEYGLMYISVGDGGWFELKDPVHFPVHRRGQDLADPFGSILRIKPRPGDKSTAYTIPDSNPFAGNDEGILPEIWAYGLRNPQRFSWDPENGNMYISDIGQFNIEEINLGIAGANYGWRHREGTYAVYYDNDVHVVPAPSNDARWNFTYPVLQYDHDEGQAVAGGFVYRGNLIPELRGYYVFSDLVNGRIFYADVKNIVDGQAGVIRELSLYYQGKESDFLEILNNDYRADLRLGLDRKGEIYVMTKRDGKIRKLLPMPTN